MPIFETYSPDALGSPLIHPVPCGVIWGPVDDMSSGGGPSMISSWMMLLWHVAAASVRQALLLEGLLDLLHLIVLGADHLGGDVLRHYQSFVSSIMMRLSYFTI